MVIRPARHDKTIPVRKLPEGRDHLRGVIWIVDLDPGEAVLDQLREPPEDGTAGSPPRMRQHRHTVVTDNHLHGLLGGQLGPEHVCRAVSSNEPLERLLGRADPSGLDKGAGDVGAAHRCAGGDLDDPRPLDRVPEGGEASHHLLCPAEPAFPHSQEERLERFAGVVHEVPEDVHLVLADVRVDFHAGDHVDA